MNEHDITTFTCQKFGEDLAIVWWEHTLRATFREDPFDDIVQRQLFEDGVAFAVTTVWQRSGIGWQVISQDAHVVQDGYRPRDARTDPDILAYP